MKKFVVGASRALSAEAAGTDTGAAWQERLFFSFDGMGRQTNPVIRASYCQPQPVAAGASAGVQALCGFESVTLLLQGGLHTRDSAGHTHAMQPGDVLWNGAGRGLLRQDSADAGMLALVQLWINLPAEYKLTEPHCQPIAAAEIPCLPLPNGAGQLRLIAGQWQQQQGPAATVMPLQLWNLHLKAGHQVDLPLPQGWYAVLLVLQGQASLPHWPAPVSASHMALLDAYGDEASLQAGPDLDCRLILASGLPLNESVSGHIDGQTALVMNRPEQVAERQQALRQGAFGAWND